MNKSDQILACRVLADDYLSGRWQKIIKTVCSLSDSPTCDNCSTLSDFARLLLSLVPAEILKEDWEPALLSQRNSFTEARLRYCATHLLGACNNLACRNDQQYRYKLHLFCISLGKLLKSDDDFILIADVFSFPDSLVSLSQSIRIFYSAYSRRLRESFPEQMTVVLGMHRSGTSALTGLLGNLGIAGPTDALGATENNLLGYWESTSLVTSSDRFLASQNSHWSTLYRWSLGWWKSAAALDWIDSYWHDLQNAYNTKEHFVLKDPRLCILIEGMTPCLVDSLLQLDFLLILRSPVEVVISLCKAEEISPYDALNLWIGSVLRAECISRPYSRNILTYYQLMNRPQSILDSFGLNWNQSFMESTLDQAKSFLRPSLYRTKIDNVREPFVATNPELTSLLELAEEIFDCFQHATPDIASISERLNYQWVEILAGR
jgi:hypothetical protein